MQRFRFNLQTVLKVRRQNEKRHKQEYFDQKQKMLAERRRVEALEAEVRRAAAEARERESRYFEVVLEQAYCDYLQLQEKRIRQGRESIRRMEEELQQRLQALIQARRAVRVLEQVRERRYAEYRKENRRSEQRFFDDMAVLRHQPAEER